jgi:hypothetical protein
VYRLAYNGDIAVGQLAVFQGASEAPISEVIRAERATRKNSQLATARRVALKTGRRLRCSSVTSSSTFLISRLFCLSYGAKKWGWMRPPRALPAAHFERDDAIIICETVHLGDGPISFGSRLP